MFSLHMQQMMIQHVCLALKNSAAPPKFLLNNCLQMFFEENLEFVTVQLAVRSYCMLLILCWVRRPKVHSCFCLLYFSISGHFCPFLRAEKMWQEMKGERGHDMTCNKVPGLLDSKHGCCDYSECLKPCWLPGRPSIFQAFFWERLRSNNFPPISSWAA